MTKAEARPPKNSSRAGVLRFVAYPSEMARLFPFSATPVDQTDLPDATYMQTLTLPPPSVGFISKSMLIYKYVQRVHNLSYSNTYTSNFLFSRQKAAESQAGLFKDGYAELKACLEEMKEMKEMKKYRPPPPLSSSSGMTPAVEAGRRLSEEAQNPKAHYRSHRRPSELAAASDDIDNSRPAAEGRAGAVKSRRVDKSDGGGCRGATWEARAKRGSSRRVVDKRGECTRDEDEGGDGSVSNSSAASEGSGTLWVRVMPTDENSSEEDLKSPRSRSPDITTTPCRGRAELLRRYLSNAGGGGPESETTLSGSRSRTGAAKA